MGGVHAGTHGAGVQPQFGYSLSYAHHWRFARAGTNRVPACGREREWPALRTRVRSLF